MFPYQYDCFCFNILRSNVCVIKIIINNIKKRNCFISKERAFEMKTLESFCIFSILVTSGLSNPQNSVDICPVNEEFDKCDSHCEPKCIDDVLFSCEDKCVAGCRCIHGLLRDNYSGRCVKPQECSKDFAFHNLIRIFKLP